jgi:hypothetical protein
MKKKHAHIVRITDDLMSALVRKCLPYFTLDQTEGALF